MIEYGKVEISTQKGIQATVKVYENAVLGASEFEEDFDLPDTNFEQKGFSNTKWLSTDIDVSCQAKVSFNYKDYHKKQTNSNTNYTVFLVVEVECEE